MNGVARAPAAVTAGVAALWNAAPKRHGVLVLEGAVACAALAGGLAACTAPADPAAAPPETVLRAATPTFADGTIP